MSVYLTSADLKTHIYDEVKAIITRTDDTIIDDAILSAIDEAKGYLSRYDLVALFGDETNNIAPTVTDSNLKRKIKDIARWNIIQLANPNIDMAVSRTAYEDSIRWLKDVQAGRCNPDGWPYIDTTGETAPNGDQVEFVSRPKRNNYFY